jgi:putative transposase
MLMSYLHKFFKYRLYPTKLQLSKLEATLEGCRYIYNKTLELHKNALEKDKKNISLYDLSTYLTQWKISNSNLC